MSHDNRRAQWTRLRFSIIGPLLAAPPPAGELGQQLAHLAQKSYRHPATGEALRFGASTIERWLYLARNHPDDPIRALARKVPGHAGTHPSMSAALMQTLRAQYREHPRWSYQLHHVNLAALVRDHPELGSLPSYTTVARFMKAAGLVKRPRARGKLGAAAAGEVGAREHRSFEMPHVHALWHADFHEGSRRVLLPSGQWARCHLFGCLDDRSRLCCHLQWYLEQSAEAFVHGLSQAILKRGLPRSLLTDNGGAMLATETTEGLHRLALVHDTTLPYSPEQNGKQEHFWCQIEGRLLPMLESEPSLTLELLNRATQAWVELEYHRRVHGELGDTPLAVALSQSSVGRPPPSPEALRSAFRCQEVRTQRRSDGTLTVGGVRFELPSRYRTLLRPTVRFARWDLSSIDLVDPRTDSTLCTLYPIDKHRNADGKRRTLAEPAILHHAHSQHGEPPASAPDERHAITSHQGIAPHLRDLMAEYAATGLPPAYLPHPERHPLTEPAPPATTNHRNATDES
jgi:transposase InsO family protein